MRPATGVLSAAGGGGAETGHCWRDLVRAVCLHALVLIARVAIGDVAAACPGDCNDDGVVVVDELQTGVALALARGDPASCAHFDANRDALIDVAELVAGVTAALTGCAPVATPVAASPTPTVTVTPAPNRPPLLLCRDVIRTVPGVALRVPLPVLDPDGDALTLDGRNLPRGARVDAAAAVLEWTPLARQIGAHFATFSARDAAPRAQAVEGTLAFQVLPPDPCSMPQCDASRGCSAQMLPLTAACCSGADRHRLEEPLLACPYGRLLHFGRNGLSFGRLQNCDALRVHNFAQVGAVVPLNVEVRCLDLSAPVALHVRLETATRLLFDERVDLTLPAAANGFGRLQTQTFRVLGPGPFYEFEGAEALLTASAADAAGAIATRQVRVVLTFTRPAESDDAVDPTPRDAVDACVADGAVVDE
jgi:hypothetical protein